ncbi:uncharacterized protein KY384_000204 [Bacidia gigantensis]|uniref:uncharacterized protein n=1 Tax=Bacidia gigantensis TaxID=2732470 RepID=UPI001D042984|nr:uncharacterized protein KY384_000204 [Bacidia gigantensis]KAG8526211.1 hypothetical protein KY384_000204 [Bacidia gigantensis]
MEGVMRTTLAEEGLRLLSTGKVREIYELDSSRLLFVATDRVSAFDVVLDSPIPQKGSILTQISDFWFKLLSKEIPSLKTHLIHAGLPDALEQTLKPEVAIQVQHRSMVVKKVNVLPIESIVRGYITGSAWTSYQNDGTFVGISLPSGLKESQKLEQPIWTPSTKAEQGQHDENISAQEVARIVGEDLARQIERLSLLIYEKASAYAAKRGVIIADTKFEFGVDESTDPPSLTLIDEVLTPDSSRFWSATKYEIGRSQVSVDKQYLRDWLVETSQKGKRGVAIPKQVAKDTSNRYNEAYQMLTGDPWDAK